MEFSKWSNGSLITTIKLLSPNKAMDWGTGDKELRTPYLGWYHHSTYKVLLSGIMGELLLL